MLMQNAEDEQKACRSTFCFRESTALGSRWQILVPLVSFLIHWLIAVQARMDKDFIPFSLPMPSILMASGMIRIFNFKDFIPFSLSYYNFIVCTGSFPHFCIQWHHSVMEVVRILNNCCCYNVVHHYSPILPKMCGIFISRGNFLDWGSVWWNWSMKFEF